MQLCKICNFADAASSRYDGRMIAPELLEILACPKCHGKLDLVEEPPALDCAACRLRYRIEDGIPVMLIEEAEPLG